MTQRLLVIFKFVLTWALAICASSKPLLEKKHSLLSIREMLEFWYFLSGVIRELAHSTYSLLSIFNFLSKYIIKINILTRLIKIINYLCSIICIFCFYKILNTCTFKSNNVKNSESYHLTSMKRDLSFKLKAKRDL